MILGVICLFAATARAQPPSDPAGEPAVPVAPETISRDDNGHATVRTMRLPSPMAFDGRLDESFYRDVKSFGDFIQQDPIEGGTSTDRTDVWVFFDDENLYVSARLWEQDPGRRVANEMR